MRQFIRLFLSLFFLLLCGNEFIYADAYQESFFYSPNDSSGQTSSTSLSTATIQTVNYSFPGKERRICKIFLAEDEDEDDDEISYLKKYTTSSDYFTAFYGQNSQYSSNAVGVLLPDYVKFAHISYDRYILFRVIRV